MVRKFETGKYCTKINQVRRPFLRRNRCSSAELSQSSEMVMKEIWENLEMSSVKYHPRNFLSIHRDAFSRSEIIPRKIREG